MGAMNASPTVSIVIPNWNGAHHLRDCLGSLQELDYPDEKFEVIVVDNGSVDESRSLIESEYPWVLLIPLDKNLGFAAASNEGARRATSECIVFLNNDMRVEPGWLGELARSYEPADGYVCVAGTILDWEGTRIGFTRGWVNFLGHAGQDHYLEPLDERLIEDGSDLLFACGGSMLIRRDVFLDLGGFDPEYFAFFEDVDLGWRLWLSGYKVRLAGGARVQHRHHATSSAIPLHRLAVLYERNALFTLIKNLEDDNLAPILASALFMLVKRTLVFSKSPRENFDLDASDDSKEETVLRYGLAPLHATSDVIAGLPKLLDKRREVQSRRRRADSEIFALFNRPFVPFSQEEGYIEGSLNVRAAFGLDQLFTRQRVTRVLVVANGESERLREIANATKVLAETTFLTPASSDDVLRELLAESDLVIADAATTHAKAISQRTNGLLVVDLADGKTRPSHDLLQRADVLLSSSKEVQLPETVSRPGPWRRAVIGSAARDGSLVLREIIHEPWRWRRDGVSSAPVAVPEDFQELLRNWREHYRRGGLARRTLRATQRWLPKPVERSVRRLLRRPHLTG